MQHRKNEGEAIAKYVMIENNPDIKNETGPWANEQAGPLGHIRVKM